MSIKPVTTLIREWLKFWFVVVLLAPIAIWIYLTEGDVDEF